MADLLLTNGKLKIGAMLFPDRKNPSLVVAEGNQACVYGHFHSIDSAKDFMRILGQMVGAEFETDEKPAQEVDFDYSAED